MAMHKIGVSLPDALLSNLNYLSSACGVSRSEIIVDLLTDTVADMAGVMRESLEVARLSGGAVSELTYGARAIELFEKRLLEGSEDLKLLTERRSTMGGR